MSTIYHDRKITISIGTDRRDMSWKAQTMTVGELYERLRNPVRSPETLAEYMRLKKADQDNLKDVGGFMAGTLSGPRRKSNAVTGRDVITLDFDNIPGWGAQGIIDKMDSLNCSYCIYSTRKHTPNAPRLRIIVPLNRTVTPDEYEPCARRIADCVGINMTDPTTFDVSRLMYWPSVCSDGEYIFKTQDKPLISAEFLLSTYADWHDLTSWPQVPGAVSYQKLAVEQSDPEAKAGIVGAFCRTYDVYRALDELIPGLYAPVDNTTERYTYLGGSTTGGAVIYDHGKFLFSHHATDPCSGRLVNAFDLVRLHRFGDKDDAAAAATPPNKLPSYKAMCEFAVSDSSVAALLSKEQYEEARKDFEGITAVENMDPDADPDAWMQKLQLAPQSGAIKGTIDNIRIILENDPLLKGKFAINLFANRGEVLGPVPWNTDGRRRLWSDTDNNGMYWYLERFFGITGRGNIDAALDIHASTHAFNEVQEYIKGLVWDGVQRLDTLFIEYLGAKDTPYNRAVCRKAFTAAVARAMDPGCKFDNMVILTGPQGLGKSTLLDKMSRGWFNDSIRTFEGKEASELLQGVWLVEIAELDAFRRTDIARIKQFLSLKADRYRAAYARNAKEFPRCCVFFGTTNTSDFLQDTTGNRRFWPVDVAEETPRKSVFFDLSDEIINQLWAEAKAYWTLGEPLYLVGELESAAQGKQEEHREATVREGLIHDFVNRKVPADWSKWPIDRRRDFWSGATHGDIELVERDRISAVEIWCELFNGTIKDMKRTDTSEINAVLERMPGWKRKAVHCGPYCTQRGFVRKH